MDEILAAQRQTFQELRQRIEVLENEKEFFISILNSITRDAIKKIQLVKELEDFLESNRHLTERNAEIISELKEYLSITPLMQ